MNSFFEKLFFINKKTERDNEISDKWLENENLLFSNKMKKRRIVLKNTKKEYCPHCYSQKLKKIYSHFFNGHHNHNEESNQEKNEQQEIDNLKIDMTDEKDLYKNTGFFDYVEDKNKILDNKDIVKKINYNDIEKNRNNKNELDNIDNELKNNQNEEYNDIDNNNNNIIGGKINDNYNYNNYFQNNFENNQLNENELNYNNQNNENEKVHNYINENEIEKNEQNNNNEKRNENTNENKEKIEYTEIIKNNINEDNNNYQNNNYENNNNNEDNNNKNNNYEEDNKEMKIIKISKLIATSSSSEENENSIRNDYTEKYEYNINYNNQQYNNINNKIDEIFETVNNPQIIESFSSINKQTQSNQYHYISKDKLDTGNIKSSPFSFRENSMDEETVKNFTIETEKKPKLILKVNKYFAPDQKLSILFNQVKNAYKLTKPNQD